LYLASSISWAIGEEGVPSACFVGEKNKLKAMVMVGRDFLRQRSQRSVKISVVKKQPVLSNAPIGHVAQKQVFIYFLHGGETS
jgi:hypothetical protein